jgi:hypothetical protein
MKCGELNETCKFAQVPTQNYERQIDARKEDNPETSKIGDAHYPANFCGHTSRNAFRLVERHGKLIT